MRAVTHYTSARSTSILWPLTTSERVLLIRTDADRKAEEGRSEEEERPGNGLGWGRESDFVAVSEEQSRRNPREIST